MRNRSAGIIIQNKKILLLERWKNNFHYFTIPGGTVEKGETVEETLKRELLEETSLTVRVYELLTESYDPNFGKCTYFLIKKYEGSAQIAKNSPEASRNNPSNSYELVWIELNNLESINLLPITIKEYLINNLAKFSLKEDPV